MSLFLVTAASGNTNFADGVTNFVGLNGSLALGDTEADRQNRLRFACDLSDLFVRASTNATTSSSTVTFRPGGANGNQSVTIPAGDSGVFEDTTNNDTIPANTLVANRIVNGGGGLLQLTLVGYTLDQDSDDFIQSANGTITLARNLTQFYSLNGGQNEHDTIDPAEARLRINTIHSNYRVFVSANGVSDASTITLMVDGGAASPTITITATGTGEFEDTTNNDSSLAGELVANRIVVGMGAHTDTGITLRLTQIQGEASERITINGGGISTRIFGQSHFIAIESQPNSNSLTESDVQLTVRNSYSVQNLRAFIFANSLSGGSASSINIRRNGVATSLSVAIPNGTTGEFEDTTTSENFTPTDNINYQFLIGGTSGDIILSEHNVQIGEAVAAAPPPIRPMPQLHPRAAQRAAPYSLWIDNLLAVEERVFPPIRPMAQLHPRAASRAAPYSYWHDNLLAVEEIAELPPIRPMPQLHPRAALRGSPLLYWLDNLLAIDEPDNLIRPMVQLLPRAALRAAPYSYWRDNLLAIEEPPALIHPMVQLLPRAALRPSPLSLWIDNLLAIEEPPALIRPMPQLLPRAALRGSPLLYWLDNLLAVEEFPPVRPMDQLHPRAALRAAPYSYWHDNLLAVEEILPPPIRPMGQLHPRAAQRAAPYSYWIDNLLAVAEIAAITVELSYVIDAIIGSPAIGFQQKQMIVKLMILKELQIKGLIGPS